MSETPTPESTTSDPNQTTQPASPDKKDKLNASDKKKDPRYLRLQIVEQEISEFNILKLYLLLIGVIISLDLTRSLLSFEDFYNFIGFGYCQACLRYFQLWTRRVY